MKIDNNTIVQRIDSVFVSRAGKEDCIICKRTKHGFKESDGTRYSIVYRIACESGDVLRGSGNCPVDIDFLKNNAFLDK
jgi:hypothetical protein